VRLALSSLCALALFGAAPAFAQDNPTPVEAPSTEARSPNFLGLTGLLYTPSAYVQGNRDASAFFFAHSDFFGGGALVGLGDRAEIGVSIFKTDSTFGDDVDVLLNGKFQLLKETDKLPAFSVGVADAFDSLDIGTSWYLVASKYFTRRQTDQPFALKGHVGYGGGIYDEEIFAGADLFFNRSMGLMAELVNGRFNVGARWQSGGFAATVGLFNFSRIGAGLSYTAHF
jgi:hypothetical protein